MSGNNVPFILRVFGPPRDRPYVKDGEENLRGPAYIASVYRKLLSGQHLVHPDMIPVYRDALRKAEEQCRAATRTADERSTLKVQLSRELRHVEGYHKARA